MVIFIFFHFQLKSSDLSLHYVNASIEPSANFSIGFETLAPHTETNGK